MSLQHHTHPDNLERYAFLWSEVRLLIAAIALLIGGVPPILYFFPFGFGLITLLLKLSWIISGVASVYLLYRWFTGSQKLFGHKDTKDTVAFIIMTLSGINLGLVGLIGQNIGMSIASSYAVFVITAVIYLASAYHLYTRWNKSGQKLFK